MRRAAEVQDEMSSAPHQRKMPCRPAQHVWERRDQQSLCPKAAETTLATRAPLRHLPLRHWRQFMRGVIDGYKPQSRWRLALSAHEPCFPIRMRQEIEISQRVWLVQFPRSKQRGRQHWRYFNGSEPVFLKPFPTAATCSYGDVKRAGVTNIGGDVDLDDRCSRPQDSVPAVVQASVTQMSEVPLI